MTDITKALQYGWPGAQWSMLGDDYAGLAWIGPGRKPTIDEINAKWDEYKLQPRATLVEAIEALLEAQGDAAPQPVKDYLAARQRNILDA